MRKKCILILALLIISVLVSPAAADNDQPVPLGTPAAQGAQPLHFQDGSTPESAMEMLVSIIQLKENLKTRMAEKRKFLEQSDSSTEKAYIEEEISQLDKQLASAVDDFERIAAGVDVGLFAEKKAERFKWKDELVSLLEPGIMELKRLTVRARHKTKLKDELTSYQALAPVAARAKSRIEELIAHAQTDPALKGSELILTLEKLLPEYTGVESQIKNKVNLITLQLNEIHSQESSLIESSSASVKNFFKTRGLFLFIALISCIAVVFFLGLFYKNFIRMVPGYKAAYRPFHIRVIELFYRVMTVILTLLAVILVFYLFEDWVLLSLAIVFLLGMGWAAKNTLPRFVNQSRVLLNVGAVREGERVMYQGVPWLVKQINIFSRLENPDLGLEIRLPIESLMDMTSRPFHPSESWFPCRKSDWVILSDGTRGCVTSLSHEMVEMVQRGGAKKTYQTGDFLGMSPLNLSVNFRLKVVFGISYSLQEIATNKVLELLDAHIREQIQAEGYEKDLLNLRVEFAQAGASSLDLVVIADFKGDMAPLYNRLNRAIQRWCVDAATLHDWEIPFPQLTVHRAP